MPISLGRAAATPFRLALFASCFACACVRRCVVLCWCLCRFPYPPPPRAHTTKISQTRHIKSTTTNNTNKQVTNLGNALEDGRLLAALVHMRRPELMDPRTLDVTQGLQNVTDALRILHREFGVPGIESGSV
jgi:hypothetical protein